jgi:hypothetical protein
VLSAATGQSPEMADPKEEQRRRMLQALQEKQQAARAEAEQQSLDSAARPPDERDPRARSSRHGKVTADKWNQ